MKRILTSFNTRFPKIFSIVGMLLFFLVGVNNVHGATRYSVATGNWNSNATWSATSGGAPGAS